MRPPQREVTRSVFLSGRPLWRPAASIRPYPISDFRHLSSESGKASFGFPQPTPPCQIGHRSRCAARGLRAFPTPNRSVIRSRPHCWNPSCHSSRPSPFQGLSRRPVERLCRRSRGHRPILACFRIAPAHLQEWLRGTSGLRTTLGRASGAVPLPNQSRTFDLSSSELDWPRGKAMLVHIGVAVKR